MPGNILNYTQEIKEDVDSLVEASGGSISNKAVTAVLFVSPNGNNTDGSDWTNAYQTIQAALDAASTDADDCTLIMIGPHATYYDIDTTGDPTWTGNYELKGPHRRWAIIENNHASATSIMKFTGLVSISNLGIRQKGTVNGLIFTDFASRIRCCGFNAAQLTGAATTIYLDGSAALMKGAIFSDLEINGHVTHSTAIHINQSSVNLIEDTRIHDCLVGIHIEDTDSDQNTFRDIDIGSCALGIDIDGGNKQHFFDITFHSNTRNVDDEVGDHVWKNACGNFPITVYPDDFTGITVASAAGAGTWGTLTEIVAANAIDNPFRIVATHFEPAVSQQSRVRFTGDAGTVYYDDVFFDGNKNEAAAAPSGTEFIFNAGTKIEAAAKVVGGGPDNIVVWIEVQEI